MKDLLGAGRAVSRETLARLGVHEALLLRWSQRINLVAPSTLPDARRRHFADSAQLLDLSPKDTGHWVDLGTGAGFPGLVIAILAAEERPEMKVTLVEADARKAAFLSTVLRDAGVTADLRASRAEALPPLRGDVVSARGLAPLDRLLGLAEFHLASGGICLFPKGSNHAAEVAAARRRWSFDLKVHSSRTDAAGVVLEIRNLGHA